MEAGIFPFPKKESTEIIKCKIRSATTMERATQRIRASQLPNKSS